VYERPVEELRRALFGDRKDEQTLRAFDVPDGAWLLHRYNVSLVQSVLLRCQELTVTLEGPSPERLQQLYRAVKFHSLMVRVTPAEGGWRFQLDGPTSLLQHSTRYGMALASWLPTLLLQTCPWRLEAEIRWGVRKVRHTLNLSSETGLRPYTRDQGAYVTRVEEWFQERFLALESPWTLSRGGEPVRLTGQELLFPCFTFTQGERVAHLEIVGFWRKDWLKRRLTALKGASSAKLVLAVSSRLDAAKGGIEGFKGQIIPFKEVVPAKDVLAAIERLAPPIIAVQDAPIRRRSPPWAHPQAPPRSARMSWPRRWAAPPTSTRRRATPCSRRAPSPRAGRAAATAADTARTRPKNSVGRGVRALADGLSNFSCHHI
jgi:predicted nuclease of restriction endonuclease-like RecB superfamily